MCPVCDVPLGYIPDQRTLRALTPSDDGVSYALVGGPFEHWRCLNAAWGCNWMVLAGVGSHVVQIVCADAWSPRRGPTRRRRRLDAGRGEQAPARPPTRSTGAPDRTAHAGDPERTGVRSGARPRRARPDRPPRRRRHHRPHRSRSRRSRRAPAKHSASRTARSSATSAMRSPTTTGGVWSWRAIACHGSARCSATRRAAYAPALERHYASTRGDVGRAALRHPVRPGPSPRGLGGNVRPLPPRRRSGGHRQRPRPDRTRHLDPDVADHRPTHVRAGPAIVAAAGPTPSTTSRPRLGSTPIYPIHCAGAVVDKLEFVHATIRDQADQSRFDGEPAGGQ